MATKQQPQQSQSAAKWIVLVLLLVTIPSLEAAAQEKLSAELSTLAGVWIVDFQTGPGKRVYKIGSDGKMTFADAQETKEGSIVVRNGAFVLELSDRIQRFTKLSDTVLKVESFTPKSAFEKGKPHAVATGLKEVSDTTASILQFVGNWPVHFDNGVDRFYRIGDDGTVTYSNTEGTFITKITEKSGEFLLNFNGKKLQRASIMGDGRLKIEVFDPISRYAKNSPSAVGTAKKEQGALPVAPPQPATGSQQAVSRPQSPTPSATRTLSLAPTWDTAMQGGSATLDDLGRLFSGLAKPSANLTGDDSIIVYEGVPYLAPVQKLFEAAKITNRPTSKNQVACPGLPRDSLFYYAVDGRFEGNFNRMYVVVDRADQLVSVQLVDETPKADRRTERAEATGILTTSLTLVRKH